MTDQELLQSKILMCGGAIAGRLGLTDAIFQKRSFTDCAVKIARMDSPLCLARELQTALGVSDADIASCQFCMDEREFSIRLREIPDADNEVFGPYYDKLENFLYPRVRNIVVAKICKELRGDITGVPETVAIEIMKVASRLVQDQCVFLWTMFRERPAKIMSITKDAFKIVDSTKLQTGLSFDVLDQAFRDDLFIEVPVAVGCSMEFGFLRRKNLVFPFYGRKSQLVAKNGVVCIPFGPLPPIDIERVSKTATEGAFQESMTDGILATARMRERAHDAHFGRDSDDAFDSLDAARTKLDENGVGVVSGDLFKCFSFAAKLRLMLLAERNPVEERTANIGSSVFFDGIQTPPQKKDGVTYSVVSLTRDFREARASYESKGGHIDKTGKKVVEKFIAGFIRRQHYGQNNALVKTIFVSPFTNRFWVNAGVHITKVVK